MRRIVSRGDRAEGFCPSAELIRAMGNYNGELADGGIMRDGEGIKPSSGGKRVAFDGERLTVTGGAFPVVSDLVAG